MLFVSWPIKHIIVVIHKDELNWGISKHTRTHMHICSHGNINPVHPA